LQLLLKNIFTVLQGIIREKRVGNYWIRVMEYFAKFGAIGLHLPDGSLESIVKDVQIVNPNKRGLYGK